ncbi:hypothetical protein RCTHUNDERBIRD_54 [Rhodobacter phage RcThunderbird]|nr:hypothetical protein RCTHUNDERBIRD_54 [Rhodobacter phage RcThunderbird]
MKLVRATNSPAHVDNWADLAGYAACGAELATAPKLGGSDNETR